MLHRGSVIKWRQKESMYNEIIGKVNSIKEQWRTALMQITAIGLHNNDMRHRTTHPMETVIIH